MNIMKRIISLSLAILFLFESIPHIHAARGEALTINGNIIDAITDMEYGWDGTTYRFQDSVLNGVEEGDEVYLAADAVVAGELIPGQVVSVSLSNLHLEGANAAEYLPPEIADPVPIQKEINILKKTVMISPEHPYCYYGQKIPDKGMLELSSDYLSQIVEGDDITIEARFLVQLGAGDGVGEYPVILTQNFIVSGKDKDNYNVIVDPGTTFNILMCSINAEAYSEDSEDGHFEVINSTVLHAPEGYKISTEASIGDDAWSKSIEIPLQETMTGEFIYYLRNDNIEDKEYYKAIGQKVFRYSSVQTIPVITGMEIERIETDAVLNFFSFGVFGNGKLGVKVNVLGGPVAQDTTVFLGGSDEPRFKTVYANEAILVNDVYTYCAVFELDAAENESIQETLTAYPVNSSGTGATYPPAGSSDQFIGSDTSVLKPVVVDRVMPNAELVGEIEGSYFSLSSFFCVRAVFKIWDTNSGISKVEYLWDDGFKFNTFDWNWQEDFVELEGYSPDKLEYELLLPWSCAKIVEGNKHTLHLRITDRAGNVLERPFKDPFGSDMLTPVIESVAIRKTSNDISEDMLSFFSFGTFYKRSVEIAVKAHDHQNELLYASGIKEVTVNEYEAEWNKDTGEYVAIVSPDTDINQLCIVVKDKVGLKTEAFALDIENHGLIESDSLVVEDDAPTVDFGDFLDLGYQDNFEYAWFGKDNIDAEMVIGMFDNSGEVHSGLRIAKILLNDDAWLEKSDFVYKSEEAEAFKEKIQIADLPDGRHMWSVYLEDNCGNTIEKEISFGKDTVAPTDATLSIQSSGVQIDEHQWFTKEQNVLFRIDVADDNSGVKCVRVAINDQVFEFGHDEIRTDDKGQYIVVGTDGVDAGEEQKYTVSVTVVDFANNSVLVNPVTVRVDYENPLIKEFTVQKKTETIDRVLNVLSFGIYSNDSLIFRIYTSEIDNDSGIDYATINYSGISEPVKMVDEGDGVFSYELPSSEDVFESDIDVVVYDRYGKFSGSCAKITDASDKDKVYNGKFVMIETIIPTVVVSMAAPDGIERSDGQCWYNGNRPIEVMVRDVEAGIHHVNISVNGVDVKEDMQSNLILKAEMSTEQNERINDKLDYYFDTDYLKSLCGQSEDGHYDLIVEAVDNAGNIENFYTRYYIDTTAPVLESVSFSPETSDGIENTSDFVEFHEYGFYFKKDFIVTIHVSDAIPSSGLHEIEYRFIPYIDGQQQTEIVGKTVISDGKAQITVPKGFNGQIYVEAFDCTLNSSGKKTTRAYIVDNARPSIHIVENATTNFRDALGNPLYTDGNSFTVTITDKLSGLRSIGYQQQSEKASFDRIQINIPNKAHKLMDSVGDGWIVTGIDANLVTQIQKTFLYENDDNSVSVTFDAMDNSHNTTQDVKSEVFTVDKTAPVIHVVFRADEDYDKYYHQNRIADVTVIERNFDANLINAQIKNFFGYVPSVKFSEKSKTEHVAVIDFDEGDYTFDLTGKDLGSHEAIVNFSGGNEKLFSVDKTQPKLIENFSDFSNEREDSFCVDMTASLQILEHNFDPRLTDLRIMQKAPGTEHDDKELQDVTSIVLNGTTWSSTGDLHTLSFSFNQDGVYYVSIEPKDLAGNSINQRDTVVFEIDKTVPVVSKKNGKTTPASDTEFIDVYTYDRRNQPIPTVEFTDNNIQHVKYRLTTYLPDYSKSDAVVVRPVTTEGIVNGHKFKLPSFSEDGIYTIELTAIDVAGNESELNINTYARMVQQDVLAYILDSNVERKSGLYSLEYENGTPISKKPSSFEDLSIFVMTLSDTPVSIVLRDTNGRESQVEARYQKDDSIYGVSIYNYGINSEYFKENFQDDTDIEMCLTVRDQDYRIDLADIHIDNIAPDCSLPEEFKSWNWFIAEDKHVFTLKNINEVLDVNRCKVYDNGEEIDFIYSEVESTLSFTLGEGWHDVGVILSDVAGNVNNIQQCENINVGYFWLIAMAALLAILTAAGTGIALHIRKRKMQVSDDN